MLSIKILVEESAEAMSHDIPDLLVEDIILSGVDWRGRFRGRHARAITMTDEQRAALERRIKEHTQAIARDPAAAREAMIRTGIVTEDGQLAPDYRIDDEDAKETI